LSRIIAIDFGLKRIGLAVTDPLQIIATNLVTVLNSEIFDFLDKYIKNEKVEQIVVGYPKQMNNEDSELVPQIKEFVEKLKHKFADIKIELYDERFTSKLAAYAMVQAGFNKKTRQVKGNIDKMSATILLQDFLEYKKNKML